MDGGEPDRGPGRHLGALPGQPAKIGRDLLEGRSGGCVAVAVAAEQPAVRVFDAGAPFQPGRLATGTPPDGGPVDRVLGLVDRDVGEDREGQQAGYAEQGDQRRRYQKPVGHPSHTFRR